MDQRSCQLHGQYYIYNNIYQRHLMLVANMALLSSADVLPCRSMFVFEAHFRFCRLIEFYFLLIRRLRNVTHEGYVTKEVIGLD